MYKNNKKIDTEEFLLQVKNWKTGINAQFNRSSSKKIKRRLKNLYRSNKYAFQSYVYKFHMLRNRNNNIETGLDLQTSFNKENNSVDANKTIAIVIHVHYYDIFISIMERIKTLDVKFKLYITTSKLNYVALCDYFRPRVYNVTIACYENRGRDVLPFIKILNQVKLSHKYLLKIHTKKSPHRDQDGSAWREKMLDELLDKKIIENINMLFDKYPIGLIGPENYIYSIKDKSYCNRRNIKKMAKKMKFNSNIDNEFFVGGTMFYASVDALQPILELQLEDNQFEQEPLPLDGSNAHVVERIFGISVAKKKLLLVDTKFAKDLIMKI